MAQINKPSDYFNTVLYTGNNGSNRSITGVGFQPDLVWNKNRSSSANHNLWNGVTGVTERLTSSGTQASEDYSSEFISFDSDGVTITQNAGSLDFNNSSYNYVNWNWLGANGTVANTDGDIASTVSANTTSGFSIVSYTGNSTGSATFGHGLGSTPKVVIIKNRDLSDAADSTWQFWFNNTSRLNLNTTNASTATHPISTSSTLVTTPSTVNNAWNGGSDYIAYCFAEKQGYSKFGSYTGNGNADGTFVYTGFKPAWIMCKKYNVGGNWIMFDNKREPFNLNNDFLQADLSDAEVTGNSTIRCDFVSNGVKLRGTNNAINTSGGSYIYMAFAENPLVGTNNIPATAR